MTARVHRTPQADDDLVDHYAFIAEDNPGAADRFLEAAEQTFNDLLRRPGIGRPMRFRSPRLSTIRRWRVKGFEDYLIYYDALLKKAGIIVIHIRHAARDIPDEAHLEEVIGR